MPGRNGAGASDAEPVDDGLGPCSCCLTQQRMNAGQSFTLDGEVLVSITFPIRTVAKMSPLPQSLRDKGITDEDWDTLRGKFEAMAMKEENLNKPIDTVCCRTCIGCPIAWPYICCYLIPKFKTVETNFKTAVGEFVDDANANAPKFGQGISWSYDQVAATNSQSVGHGKNRSSIKMPMRTSDQGVQVYSWPPLGFNLYFDLNKINGGAPAQQAMEADDAAHRAEEEKAPEQEGMSEAQSEGSDEASVPGEAN